MKLSLALSNRKGIALPMALLVITALTAALAAGFAGVAAEYTTNAAQRGQNRAYNLAQTGLEQFMILRSQKGWCTNCVDDPAVADSEWTRISLPGGYADVVAVKVRPATATTNAMYFIRSRGVDTTVKLNAAGSGVASERIVGEYATWNTSTMKVAAAWLSLSGLTKSGTGLISGIDQCGKQPDVAGVMVDKGDLTVTSTTSFHPEGSPPVDTSNTFDQLKNKTGIDWPGIISQNSIPADITIPGDAFPSASDFDNDPSYWPVIRVQTNGYALPNRGRGIIIADSDFTINGSNMWDGIVLVGGQLTSDGNNVTAGATLSGLNFLFGGTPTEGKHDVDNSDANGQKSYVYNSCNVANAASRMRRYIVMPNTWNDNVSSW
jgi:hypothetical protein